MSIMQYNGYWREKGMGEDEEGNGKRLDAAW